MELGHERSTDGIAGGMKRLGNRIVGVPEMGVVIPLIVFILIFALLNPAMLSRVNLTVILRTIAFTGVVAVGMSFLIIAGEIDLSVGSVAGLGAIIFGWMMKNAGWPIPAAIAAGLFAGALCGLINGLLTVKIGLSSFISTLSMLFVARGVNYVITSAYPIYPLPPEIGQFGLSTPLGASWAFWVFVVLILIGDFVLRHSTFGGMVKATGGNKLAARIAGIRTDRVKIACFVLTGMLAAVGGMLVVTRIKTAEPQIGVGWELDVIASVVMGGVSFFGGVGTIIGTFLGSLLMQVVRSGLVVVKVNAMWQNTAVGMLLIAAVVADKLRREAKMRGLQ
jgi:ribose transport system permease protein